MEASSPTQLTSNGISVPLHPDSRAIIGVKIRKWLYDPRLTKTA
jgi:hypothetical protein